MSKDLSKELNKELTNLDVKEIKKELSAEDMAKIKAKKKAARRAAIEEHGRLHLAEDFKEKGYRYRPCNATPGNIESWKTKGYEVVTHQLSSGNGGLATPEVDGTPTEFEVGGANGSMKGIWMRIREEDALILDEIRDDLAREQAAMVDKVPGIPTSNLIGSVTKENLR